MEEQKEDEPGILVFFVSLPPGVLNPKMTCGLDSSFLVVEHSQAIFHFARLFFFFHPSALWAAPYFRCIRWENIWSLGR